MPAQPIVALGARKRGVQALLTLARHLLTLNHQPVVDAKTQRSVGARRIAAAGIKLREPGVGRAPVLAIALGGDGAFIQHAALYAPYGVPLIGVNFGKVGFLADIPASEMERTITAVLRGKYTDEQRVMLAVEHLRGDKVRSHYTVINDIVIDRGSKGIIDLEVTVERNRSIHLRGDGVIFATPGGSTAYNMAAGGPIIMPAAGCIAMTPLSPFSLTHRPLVFSTSAKFLVEVTGSYALLLPDGQDGGNLNQGDQVRISTHRRKMTMRHSQDYNYFTKLRDKLFWRHD